MLSNMWFGLVRSVIEKVSEAVSVKCRQAVQSLLCLAFSKRGVRPTTSPASLTEIRLPANAGVKGDVRVILSIFFSAGSNILSSAPSKCLSSSPYRNQKKNRKPFWRKVRIAIIDCRTQLNHIVAL